MSHLSKVLQFAFSQVWAMEEGFHRKMFQVLLRRAEGLKLSDEEITAATGTDMPRRGAEMRVEKGVAVIPIHGVIAQRANAVGRMSSDVGTSVEHVRRDLQAAMADDAVQAIVLDVDSPGGSVSGIEDLASEIRAARDRKPIVAHTDSMMASAGYWLASQADRIVATKDAWIGSIGVIASFVDDHRMLAGRGLDPVVVKSVPGKGGIQSNGSFGDADRAELQSEVDAFHKTFVEAVAAGRRISVEDANKLADGRAYVGAKALQMHFIDGIETNQAKVIASARSLARTRAAAATATKPGAVSAAGVQHESKEPMDENEKSAAATNPPAAAVPTPQPAAPAAAAQNPAPTPAPAPAPAPAVAVDPVFAERQRAAAIHGAADAKQHELVAKLVREGTPVGDAIAELNKDRAARVALPVGGATASMAAGNSSGVTTSADRQTEAMPEGVEKWKREWNASAELRDEFLDDEDSYIAFKRAEQKGQAKLDKATA